MPHKFRIVDLKAAFNAPARLQVKASRSRPAWHPAAEGLAPHMPRGRQIYWGIPFRLGPTNPEAPGIIELSRKKRAVTVPLSGPATHVCILHFCDLPSDPSRGTAGGDTLAEYILSFEDGSEHAVPIRRRFEINPFAVSWGTHPFAAVSSAMPRPQGPGGDALQWGWLQTGVGADRGPFQTWVYALENPRPRDGLRAITLRGSAPDPVGILAITLYNGPGHPLRHLPRKVYRLLLPPGQETALENLTAELDMGVITRLYAAPGCVDERWLASEEAGLGQPVSAPGPTGEFLVEATGAEGATLSVQVAGGLRARVPFGSAFTQGQAASRDGSVRLQVLSPRTTWVHVTVVDEATGQPTPTRVHFRGKHGQYIAPYGHHDQVDDRWFEDYGGDLQLGAQSFAYVPGRFQVELPVGEVYVEVTKGFEYTPVRRRLEIAPGQRELQIGIARDADWRRQGWVTADTHVHFISPQTAALEGKAEGLNLINLLASQWGRLYTNVADITGEASGCSDEETIVWVGTENRNHLLGHISLLGTHGDPVFPMCAGGPDEAYLGDPDVVALTEWARTCKQREGLVVRPHFPFPPCEEPVYIALGELDGVELRSFANPDAGTLDEFAFREWYRYLNCGYRVAAVGGTDKMSAGMPVGGVRTYAHLGPDEGLAFDTWARAVRAGRTFTTSGPLINMTVDGQPLGSDLRLPARGGTLEVEAVAHSVWPIHALEIVVNGQVVADTREPAGSRDLRVRHQVKLTDSAWIAARCGSRLQVNHCWPVHLGAHTSPVYVVCGDKELFSPSDATYMLTLLDGGITYLDTLSVRYSDERHEQIKALYAQAKHHLQHRLGQQHGH